MEVLAAATVSPNVIEKGRLEPSRKEEMSAAFHTFGRPPTLKEIEEHYSKVISEHKKQIRLLEQQQLKCTALAKEFWTAVKKDQDLKIKAHLGSRHRARPRTVKAASRQQ